MSINQEDHYKNLIRRLRSSDASAFEQLFRQYHQPIFNFLFYKLGESQTAEDILQDVFVLLWEKRHTVDENLSIKAFLYKIAENMALNHIRHHKVVLKYEQALTFQNQTEPFVSPQSRLEAEELRKNVADALKNLPEQQRIVFMMSRFENLAHKEIARRLNISVKTVETHIGKALKALAKEVKQFSKE